MPQQCPHCLTEIDEHATTSRACGAQRGILLPGWSSDRWKRTDRFMFILAAIPGILSLLLAYSVATYRSNTWHDGAMALLLISPVIAWFGILSLAMHYAIPRF
jgi:peptidoglycan/LPS O-acetylase OafA/YrhL